MEYSLIIAGGRGRGRGRLINSAERLYSRGVLKVKGTPSCEQTRLTPL
jgi:hypothetical protein